MPNNIGMTDTSSVKDQRPGDYGQRKKKRSVLKTKLGVLDAQGLVNEGGR